MLNIFPKVSSLPNLLALNFVKVEIWIFQTVTWCHVGHLIKGSCLRTSYTKLGPCLVWYQYISCRQRYVFYLSHDPITPLRWDVMLISWWELLAACHNPEKFGDHRHSNSYEEKCFIKNTNLINMYYHWKIELNG